MNWEKLKCVEGVKFFDKEQIVKRWNIDLYKEKELLPTITKLCEQWKVEYEKVIKFIIDNHLTRELFDYSHIYTTASKLVYEDGVYEEKLEWTGTKQIYVKHYYNVYITENRFIHLMLPKMVTYIIETFYPKFAIYEDVEKYKGVNIDKDSFIEDIQHTYAEKKLQVSDLIEIINANGKPIYEKKLIYNIYGEGDILFVHLKHLNIHKRDYDWHLIIPRDAIVNDDWTIVKNYCVHSIIKPNADSLLGDNSDNWFWGFQMDSPYWNEDKVKEIEKLFS